MGVEDLSGSITADPTGIGTLVLAAGALGTAAFGIVDTLKFTKVGALGFGSVMKSLGMTSEALMIAYGKDYRELLEAQYRKDRTQGDLRRTLRQGVRVGMTPKSTMNMAKAIGFPDEEGIAEVARKIQEGEEFTDKDNRTLGKFELAIDARIDAALAMADEQYSSKIRIVASVVSVFLAFVAALALDLEINPGMMDFGLWIKAVIVGIVAVPLAPMAKDVAKGLQAATMALKVRK
ncbi:MAG: hypothetical protein A2516_05705 [Alphaproteobacteria bacterium RIFOXYD12_FULL_60_8]|nr:MAG: hypothetical protein A2516_05705 [Alphaproteobacteria bacterium RIFOXYD12_FULL_60_8]